MKKIAVKRIDGGVSIICPTSEATPELLERDIKAVQGYVSHREIDDNELPSDRVFRNAWCDDNGIRHDLDKCRALIRDKRNSSLAELDKKAFAESRKPAGDLNKINSEAQRLRNIPSKPEFNSSDLAQLKQLFKDSDLKV